MHSIITASVHERDIGHKRDLVHLHEAFFKLTVLDLNQTSLVWIININNMKQNRISWLLNYFIFNFYYVHDVRIIVVMVDMHQVF